MFSQHYRKQMRNLPVVAMNSGFADFLEHLTHLSDPTTFEKAFEIRLMRE